MVCLTYLYILIHPLICVFIDITPWTIATTPGAVRAVVRVNPVNPFIRVSTDHQSLLINGLTTAVIDMLTAGSLNDQANFNVDHFSFDDVRYEYDYVGSSINYIFSSH